MKFLIFSVNTSWPVLMNIQMSELMMSSPHKFLFISYTEITKNVIFQPWKYKTCLITTQSKWEIMFTLIHFDMGICFYLYELKIKNFQNFIYNIKKYKKLWGDDIINSLIWIFIRTGQEMFFRKNVKFQNVISSLFLIQFFIIFSLFCRKKCTLSFKIDSILEWISPLMSGCWVTVHLFKTMWVIPWSWGSVQVASWYLKNTFQHNSILIMLYIYCL